jgi:methionyl aminopeptidase
MIVLKSPDEIEKMRKAGAVVAGAHHVIAEAVKPGITTIELDQIAAEYIASQGAKAAFLGYNGFPASICASVNEEVVHGIPGDRVLVEGDIVGVDIGSLLDGYYGDCAYTLRVGDVSDEANLLLKVTQAALVKGIDQARPGNFLQDISHAVQQEVEANGLAVVRQLVGHGIGRKMHEDPQVPNYGKPGRGVMLQEGMVLAIEPMVNVGTIDVRVLDDEWTVVTKDGSLSAHFEHTVAIRADGPDILTLQ